MFRVGPRIAMAVALVGLAFVTDLLSGRLSRLIDQRSERAYRIPHQYYHHDLRARYDGVTFWGPTRYRVRTNSLGFRDSSAREVPLRTSGHRILLIGDSFTEGIGVEYDATFAGRLATRFHRDGIDVLNAGVVSYSPAVYWKKIEYLIERRGLQFDAAVVFIDISDVKDEAWAYRIDRIGRVVDASPGMPRGNWWSRNSLTYRTLSQWSETLRPQQPLSRCEPGTSYECDAAWTVRGDLMKLYGDEGLRTANQHMSALAALLRARGILLTVVVYPWPQHLLWNDRSSLQVSHWREWAEREEAGFVELFTSFFAESDTMGVAETVRRYFVDGDVHWNARGHQLVAEAFAEHFQFP